MKKDKGFTLIELLAVIVILAIIALIATPLIMSIINDVKKGAFLDSSYAIVNAAEQGYAKGLITQNSNEETEYTFNNGNKTLKNGNIALNYKGSNPTYGNIIITDEGKISINFYKDGWCATKGYDIDTINIRKVDKQEDCVPDVVAPVITLENGDITLKTSDTSYIEPGYSAIDDTDGNITDRVVVTNNINYGVEGEYDITYTTTDTAGNTTIINRKVIIEKKEATLMGSPSGGDTTMYLNGPIVKNKIESIVFETTNIVPSGVIGSWDVSEAKDGSVMAWYKDNDGNNLYELTIGGDGKVYGNPNSSYLFQYLTNLNNINLSNFDTSNVIVMSGMFQRDSNLKNLDLTNFNTSKVTDMGAMFQGNSSLTDLNISSFNTSNVTNMYSMFHSNNSLTSLNLSNFDTSKVTQMQGMFYKVSKLTNLDLSNFDTSNVTLMNMMFQSCSGLTSLNLSNFDTSKVMSMAAMFDGTSNINTIYYNNATFTSVTNYSDIFKNSKSGIIIYTKNDTTRAWLQSRLSEAGISSTVTIAS